MKYIAAKLFFILVAVTALNLSLLSQDFEVAPIRLNFTAEPGETQTEQITLKNHHSKKQAYIFTIKDYITNSSGNREMLDANSTKHSCANWLIISPSFVELNPNEEKFINVSMQVPSGEYGSKWAMIFIKPTFEQTSFTVDEGISAGISVSPSIAINVTQASRSNTNISAAIDKLKEITTLEDTIRKFSAIVENTGDNIAYCKVFLIAADINTLEEFEFDPIVFSTFPSSTRKIELIMPSILPKGDYSLSAILDYGSSSSLEGTQIMIQVE